MNKTICYGLLSLVVIVYIGGAVFYFVGKEDTPDRFDEELETFGANQTQLHEWTTMTTTTNTTTVAPPKAELIERIFEIDNGSFESIESTILSNIIGNVTIETLHRSFHGGASFDYLLLIIAKVAKPCIESIDIDTFFQIATGCLQFSF